MTKIFIGSVTFFSTKRKVAASLVCPVQSSTMTEHENVCKPLGLSLLSKTPDRTITALISSFSGHGENPSGSLNEREIRAMSEEVIFWFLWCRLEDLSGKQNLMFLS